MSTHLAHKLPWAMLTEIVVKYAPFRAAKVPSRVRITQKQLQAVHHFARCFQSALKEFATTDHTETPELDPTRWGINETSNGGYLGYHTSLLWGYLTLNLILAEPKHAKEIADDNRWVLQVLCGYCDGGHPEHITEQIKRAFDGYECGLKPLTAEICQILRDHAALLFKCMYKISGENRYLLETDVQLTETIACIVGWFEVEEDGE